MKRFLLNLLYFVLLLAAFYGFLWGRYASRMRQFSFKLPEEKTILAIGDSQMQAAVNDSILTNVANVSDFHENYWSMLIRIQLYKQANPQIDTILLGVTPHTVARFKDEFFSNFGYMEKVTKYYLPWLKPSEWFFLFSHDATDVLSALVTPLSFYWSPTKGYIRDMGHFEAADYSHLETDIAEGASRLTENPEYKVYGNKETLRCLHRIIEWCHSENIHLIGLDTPVYHAAEYFNMENYQHLMTGEFSGLERWEYLDLDIPDDYRRDVNHLNCRGADFFTNLLSERL